MTARPSTDVDHRGQHALALGVLAVIGWGWMLSRIGEGDVYAGLGPYSVVVVFMALLLRQRGGVVDPARERHHAWHREVAIGIAVGVAMTLGTYVAYAGVAHALPAVEREVRVLYAAAHVREPLTAIAWTCVAIAAEELLFRGWLFDALAMQHRRGVAAAFSLTAYVAAQLASGSWVIALAALICGALWTIERTWTRSWIAPLVSHAIWTITIVHVLPVG